jgi:phosphoribosyl 1,2-cyclic phosphate phosphodiesterase
MKLTFLGTGTSMGVPVAGGFQREDIYHDPRNERTRCSVLIETNQLSFLIDVGPEFRIQSIRSRIQKVDFALITHEHMDHIGGLDDLRMFNYIAKGAIPIYSSASAKSSILHRFDYMFGEKKYPGSTSLDLKIASTAFNIGDVTITPLPVKHGSLNILGYRINNTAYLTDVSEIPASTQDLIADCSTLILSALRWKPEHPTHLTIPQAIDLVAQLGNPQTYLIHMNTFVDHRSSNQKLPGHIRLAYDMQIIEVD